MPLIFVKLKPPSNKTVLCVLTIYFIFTLLQGIAFRRPIPAQAQTSNEE